MQTRSWRHQIFAALVALLVTVPAWADPPGRVGRIAWMSGSVQLRNADTGEWNTAVLNWPLTSGDVLSTGPGARAELRIGSTAVRLDSSSEIEILQLDDDRIRVQLDKGSVATRFFSRDDTNGFELVTRVGSFTAPEAGSYRFDYDNNTASATVRRGSLHFESDDSALTLRAGTRADFWYSGATNYSLSDPERDDFSDWVALRERKDERVASARYVPRDMTGVEDLDDNGDWYESSDYGPVWYPRVVEAGWAPYRSGHWAWVSPWGWTWVDDAAWGFAPFHYGRWVWYRERWGWVPGRVVARPVYAPALVAWIGTPSVSISISSGPSVGWFPLAPREVYVPSYRCSPAYVRNVNVTHVTNITNVTTIINNPQTVVQQTKYVNRRLPQAVTVVSRDVVEGGRPVKVAAFRPQDKRFVDTLREQPARSAAPVATPPAAARTAARDDRRDDRKDDKRDDPRRDRRDDGRDQNRAAPGQPGIAPAPGKAAQGDGREARDIAKPAPREDKGGDPRSNRNARDARDARNPQRPAEAADKPGAQQPAQAAPDKRNPARPDGVGAADERRDPTQKPAPANAAPNVDPRAPAAQQERNSDRNADRTGRDVRGPQPGDGAPRSLPAPVQQSPGRPSSPAPEDAAPRGRSAPDGKDARAEQPSQIQQRQTPQRDELQQERQRLLEQQRQQQQRQDAQPQRQEMQQRENAQRQQEAQQRQELQRQQEQQREQQRQDSRREEAQRQQQQQQQQQRMEQQQRAQEVQQRQEQQRQQQLQQQRNEQQQEMRRQAEAQQQARREAVAQQQRAQQEQQQQQRAQEQQRRAQEERAAQQKKDNKDDNR